MNFYSNLTKGTPRAESTNITESNATTTDEVNEDREMRKPHEVQTTMDFAANIEKVKEVSGNESSKRNSMFQA